MRVLIGLLLALASMPAAAGEEEVFASVEAGDLAGALALTAGETDPDRLQRLAERFYGEGSAEGVEAALQLFQRALVQREARAGAEPGPLADLLHDLSSVHFNAGDYAKAEEAERRALDLRARLYPQDDVRTAESRRDLALVFLAQGRLAEASSELPKALAVIEAAAPQDFLQVAIGRNYLAEMYRLQGRSAEAAAVLEDLCRQSEEKLGLDNPRFHHFLNNLAGVYRDEDRFDDAETLLRRSLALRLAATPRDDGDVAAATLNLAELYRVQGKLEESEPLYAEALRLARQTLAPDSPELCEFINQTAVLYRDQGRLQEAEARFREALDLAERGLGRDHPRVAQSRLDLAELLRTRGRCQEAAPHYRRALEIREGALGSDHPDVAEALTAQARCFPARASLDRALSILGGSQARPALGVEARMLRADLRRGNDREGARRDLSEALRLVEAMRPHRGGGEGVRAAFFGRYASLYERLVRLEVEGGHPERALEVAERGRARALLDQLAAVHVGEQAKPAPDIEARQTAVRAELAEIRERMAFEQSRKDLTAKERRARTQALEARLDVATRSFRLLYDEARNADPRWRRAIAGEPASLADIQREVVPGEGLLLLYQIGSEGSVVFAVPRGPGAVVAKALVVAPAEAAVLGVRSGPLTEESLRRVLSGDGGGLLARLAPPAGSAARGIGGLSGGVEDDGLLPRLHALWRVLVPSSLWPRLTRSREVLVVPDGALSLLPLEALVVRAGLDLEATRFWLDVGPVIRYAPSATLVRDLARRAATAARGTALTVSDPAYPAGGALPRLPGTALETEAVRKALGGITDVTVLQGDAAREPAVRSELTGRRYIHLASHGFVDRRSGELFAALALTPPPAGAAQGEDDGFLQLFEIYDLRLDAELAVLSACGSNTGRRVAGEGVFALSRGFLVAGARRVIASQWQVDDASTAEMVGDLFGRIAAAEKAGAPLEAARALRDAKLRLRRGTRWSHPFFWAPFVLTGAE